MKNVWKGLMVGGLTGAAIGVTLDGGARARAQVHHVASDATEQMRHLASGAAGWISDADVAGKAVDLRDRVVESDAMQPFGR